MPTSRPVGKCRASLTLAIYAQIRSYICSYKELYIMPTSRPVGKCRASLTLAKLPLPMVLRSLYLPTCWESSAPPDREEWGFPDSRLCP